MAEEYIEWYSQTFKEKTSETDQMMVYNTVDDETYIVPIPKTDTIFAVDFGINGEGEDYSEGISNLNTYISENNVSRVVFPKKGTIYTDVSIEAKNGVELFGNDCLVKPIENSTLFANQKCLIRLNDGTRATRFKLDGNHLKNTFTKNDTIAYSGASSVTANVMPIGISGVWVLGDRCKVDNNEFTNISWACIDVNGKNHADSTIGDIEICDNTFYNSAEDHVALHSCHHVEVHHNIHHDFSNHAIHPYSFCHDVEVHHNRLDVLTANIFEWNDGYVAASQKTGIILDHPAYSQSHCYNIHVHHNYISGEIINGIEITGYVGKFLIEDNEIEGYINADNANAGIGIRFKTTSVEDSVIQRNKFRKLSKAININTISTIARPTWEGGHSRGTCLVKDNSFEDLTTVLEMFAVADFDIDSYTLTLRGNKYNNVKKCTNIGTMLSNFNLEIFDDIDMNISSFNGNTLYDRDNTIRLSESENINLYPYDWSYFREDTTFKHPYLCSQRYNGNSNQNIDCTGSTKDTLLINTALKDESAAISSYTYLDYVLNKSPFKNANFITLHFKYQAEVCNHIAIQMFANDKMGNRINAVTLVDEDMEANTEYVVNRMFDLSKYDFNNPNYSIIFRLQFGNSTNYDFLTTNFKLYELGIVNNLMYNIPIIYANYSKQEMWEYSKKDVIYSNTKPSSGNWYIGDMVMNINPNSNGYLGWVCTTAGTGKEAVWKAFGIIDIDTKMASIEKRLAALEKTSSTT